ncbi:MAG TPA: VTT domain-containing protein [Chitinophagaceae bacterium]|nr:VTT domain-containing protein [Chitinophagaceae bacterium]
MDSILNFLQEIFELFTNSMINPEWILKHGGMYLIIFIIFAETGLFIGFFLPGDALVFVTGIIIANASQPFETGIANLVFWDSILILAAILGNIVGYWFGKKSGPMLYKRKDSWIFKAKHLRQATEFYIKRGGTAIIVARFLPIIRTFAPIVAGIVKMEYKKFLRTNVIGAILWILSFTSLGFLFGNNPIIADNLHYIVIGLIIITTGPVLFKMLQSKVK